MKHIYELPTRTRNVFHVEHTTIASVGWIARAIELCFQPFIAMVEGSVRGGACEMVLGCGLIVAAEDTTIVMTPSKPGVPNNVSGALNFVKVASLYLLKEMLFTALPVSATRLESCGIVNHVCSREELEPYTMRLAHQIAKNSPMVQRVLKEGVRVLANAHPINAETYERLQSLRREVYDSSDYQEGIRAFFENVLPTFREAKDEVARGCPFDL